MRWQTAFQTSKGRKNAISLCALIISQRHWSGVWFTGWKWAFSPHLSDWPQSASLFCLRICVCEFTQARAVSFSVYIGETQKSASNPFIPCAAENKSDWQQLGPSLCIWKGRWRNLHRKPKQPTARHAGKVPFDFISNIAAAPFQINLLSEIAPLQPWKKETASVVNFWLLLAFHLTKAAVEASQFKYRKNLFFWPSETNKSFHDSHNGHTDAWTEEKSQWPSVQCQRELTPFHVY